LALVPAFGGDVVSDLRGLPARDVPFVILSPELGAQVQSHIQNGKRSLKILLI